MQLLLVYSLPKDMHQFLESIFPAIPGHRLQFYLAAHIWASLVAQLVKNPPAMWETWVQSLGWEDPLEKGREWLPIPVFWPGEFYGLNSPWGCKEVDTTERLSLSLSEHCIRTLVTSWVCGYRTQAPFDSEQRLRE